MFFPSLVLGLFWRGATARGAVAGMLVGASVTVGYMLLASPGWRAAWGLAPSSLWGYIHPVSAGVFGVPAGFVAIALVSWWDGLRAASVRGA